MPCLVRESKDHPGGYGSDTTVCPQILSKQSRTFCIYFVYVYEKAHVEVRGQLVPFINGSED